MYEVILKGCAFVMIIEVLILACIRLRKWELAIHCTYVGTCYILLLTFEMNSGCASKSEIEGTYA
jgi:hypothetical protein